MSLMTFDATQWHTDASVKCYSRNGAPIKATVFKFSVLDESQPTPKEYVGVLNSATSKIEFSFTLTAA
jgi:hypothetical protein